jgi:hypothetical protein
MNNVYLLTNTLPHILETLPNIGRVIICLIRILARGRQNLLMGSLQRIDPRLQLDIVMRQLRLLAGIAGLLFDPLLAAGRKGRDAAADGGGEGAELVHCCAGVDLDGRGGVGLCFCLVRHNVGIVEFKSVGKRLGCYLEATAVGSGVCRDAVGVKQGPYETPRSSGTNTSFHVQLKFVLY